MILKLLVFAFSIFVATNAVNENRKEEDPPKIQMKPSDLKPLATANSSCRPGDVDLMFVVDGSGSIGRSNFETVRQFLKNIVSGLQIERSHSRVGMVQFTTYAQLEFHLNAYSTTTDINNAIENMRYMAGGTYIAAGMNRALQSGFNENEGARADIADVMIVLTDGQDGRTQDVRDAYNAASRKGVTVIAIGVGRGVNIRELDAIAGNDPAHIFDVSGFSDLSSIIGSICDDIQDLDPCSPDPCNGHGSCSPVNNSTEDYFCTCEAGYHGANCENSVCQNDGTFKCICPFGFTGPTCGQVIDFCNETQILRNGSQIQIPFCGPHGMCVNTGFGAACQCDPDWTGIFCDENINDCNPNPCHHGATCIDNPSEPGYTCECDPLHQGYNCSENKDYCRDTPIILNGTTIDVPICGEHGICQNTPSGALCVCQETEYANYTGQFCENEIPKQCEWKGNTYPHNSTWVEKCDSCACIYGQVECADAYWCPQRCALYSTPAVAAQNISLTCPTNMNCIPDNVACAKPVCDLPIGWCFPVGQVMVDTITFPTNPPQGYKTG